ncbi:hypothetical protein CDL15_Pgr011521 [Punica granatum]|uniref:Uncharacterized protein n=1 Tax=Punica granatum TaxID=22663 RepID=A0A218VUK1_PUNGR|nr:hypothetical protein CDL15_Pgr011521 [Punica granatum]
MTDFPPNPEDGEQWLPSDVFHEIESGEDAEVVSPKSNSSTHYDTASDEISVDDQFDHVGVDDPKGETAKSSKKFEDPTISSNHHPTN